MTFRPYPLLTVFTVAALGLLIWLGSWQLDRRAWKQDLLAEFAATREAEPVRLEAALCGGAAAPGRAFALDALETDPTTLRFYGTGPEGGPGWRVFTALTTPDCAQGRAILAEIRFEPLDTARAGASGVPAATARVDRLRFERPRGAGPFTPTGSSEGFYAFAPREMAAALELPAGALERDWWLARDTGAAPAHLTQTPPERHMAYAITWFAMALALIAVYAAFHHRAGRLALTRQ